jgi:hypothetical protein
MSAALPEFVADHMRGAHGFRNHTARPFRQSLLEFHPARMRQGRNFAHLATKRTGTADDPIIGEIRKARDRWSYRPKTAARACFLRKGVDDPCPLARTRALAAVPL